MDASELLDAQFRTIKADPQAWRALFATDAVFDMPFAPPSLPSSLKGIDVIFEGVSGFTSQFSDDVKVDVKNIYRIEGADAVVAEFSASGTVISTGKVYKQDYIAYLRAENGKIVFYREYFDPTRIAPAFTP